MRVRQSYLIVLFFSTLVNLTSYATPLDLNGDGFSDIVSVKKVGKSKEFEWFGGAPGVSTQSSLGSVGANRDIPVPGFWIDGEEVSLGALSILKKGRRKRAFLRVLEGSEVEEIELGGRKSQFIVGGDLDGNGVGDLGIVKNNGDIQVRLNPLSSNSSTVTLSFDRSLKREGFPIFFNIDGSTNTFGYLSIESFLGFPRYILTLRDVAGTGYLIRLGGVASGELQTAFPLKGRSGKDDLVILKRVDSGTEVTVYSTTGSVLYSRTFSKKREVLVGDFLQADGEELLIKSKRKGLFVNPGGQVEESVVLPKGRVVDHIYIGSVVGGGGSTSSSGNGPCDRFLPAPDGSNGFLAKNSDHGGIVYLTPNGSYSNGVILHHRTLRKVQDTRYTGIANGSRGHFRIPGSLPFGPHVFAADLGGKTHCWRIPGGLARVD